MILYVSDSGGIVTKEYMVTPKVNASWPGVSRRIVTKEYMVTPKEEAQNLAAARVVADEWVCVVALLQPSRGRGIKSADSIVHKKGYAPVEWEIKTNIIHTSRAIDNAIRKAGKQADSLILHVVSDISDIDLWRGIKSKLRQTDLQELAIALQRARDRDIRCAA